MTSRFRNITVDCADAVTLARFWSAVLGWPMFSDEDPEVLVASSLPEGGPVPSMLFIPVPEGKSVKNRLHVDLQPTDRSRDEEVARVVELGARVVEDHRNDDGTGWVYLADPEGNEFCIERSADERALDAPQHYRLANAP